MTGNPVFDIMKELRENLDSLNTTLSCAAVGQRKFSRSTEGCRRCPSIEQDDADEHLQYLNEYARILVSWYLRNHDL